MKQSTRMISLFGLVILSLAGACGAAASIPLFNGKDLTGWKAFLVDAARSKEDVWSVRDGILVCKGEPLGFIYTERTFTSFELVVEWRWAPGTQPGNSGVLMRINGRHRGVPRSLEAQLKSGDAGDLYAFHGMRIDGPAERKRQVQDHELLGDFIGVRKIAGKEKSPGEWNLYEIRLAGAELTVRVNGEMVNQATGCEILVGPIGLQSEGGEIHFRRVELKALD